MILTFEARGHPVTQGNHRAFVVNGVARITEKRGDRLALWRHTIRTAAGVAMGDALPMSGPLCVRLDFSLPKPASAPKRKRTWPIGARSGDTDKLCRAAYDAMTGVVYGDDAQVVSVLVTKDYGDKPGVLVSVWPITESDEGPQVS